MKLTLDDERGAAGPSPLPLTGIGQRLVGAGVNLVAGAARPERLPGRGRDVVGYKANRAVGDADIHAADVVTPCVDVGGKEPTDVTGAVVRINAVGQRVRIGRGRV